jgi:hypothetical protein
MSDTSVSDTSVSDTAVPEAPASSNIAPSGAGYVWFGMTSAGANTNRTAKSGINDNNATTNVDVQVAGDAVNAWEAAGVVWSSARSVSSASFVNGDVTSVGDGYFESTPQLQFTRDGVTWTNSGWSVSPAYPFTSTAGGKTYTFSGSLATGVLGARVAGQVRVLDGSYYWRVKEVLVTGS